MKNALRWLLCFLCTLPALASAATGGLKGDGTTDNTQDLQGLLGQGSVELVFPKGTYLLGTVSFPANVTLRGEPGARVRLTRRR